MHCPHSKCSSHLSVVVVNPRSDAVFNAYQQIRHVLNYNSTCPNLCIQNLAARQSEKHLIVHLAGIEGRIERIYSQEDL